MYLSIFYVMLIKLSILLKSAYSRISSGNASISRFLPSTDAAQKFLMFSIVITEVSPISSCNFVTPKFANSVKNPILLNDVSSPKAKSNLVSYSKFSVCVVNIAA